MHDAVRVGERHGLEHAIEQREPVEESGFAAAASSMVRPLTNFIT